jgi:hypothetical protein
LEENKEFNKATRTLEGNQPLKSLDYVSQIDTPNLPLLMQKEKLKERKKLFWGD